MFGVPCTVAWAPAIYKWRWAATKAFFVAHASASGVASLLWITNAMRFYNAQSHPPPWLLPVPTVVRLCMAVVCLRIMS